LRQYVQYIRQTLNTLISSVAFIWQANAYALSSNVLLNILPGPLPLATVWVTKLLFDLLAQQLVEEAQLCGHR